MADSDGDERSLLRAAHRYRSARMLPEAIRAYQERLARRRTCAGART